MQLVLIAACVMELGLIKYSLSEHNVNMNVLVASVHLNML